MEELCENFVKTLYNILNECDQKKKILLGNSKG